MKNILLLMAGWECGAAGMDTWHIQSGTPYIMALYFFRYILQHPLATIMGRCIGQISWLTCTPIHFVTSLHFVNGAPMETCLAVTCVGGFPRIMAVTLLLVL